MSDAGKACFGENFRLFGSNPSQTEKFNLYRGLALLAESVDDVSQRLHNIEHQLSQVSHNVQAIQRSN